MSQLRSDQVIDVRINRIDQSHKNGHRYPPRPVQDQTFQRLSHSSDTSIPLFTLYLRVSEEYNRRKEELLKGETDSILVFCGLFAATLAALVVPAINSTVPSHDPQTDIYQFFTLSNGFWFSTLLLISFCALHALMLRRFAKQRTRDTPQCCCLPEQARMCAYFARRIERAGKTPRYLYALIIYSLLLFFGGLFSNLANINLAGAMVVIGMVAAYPLYMFYKELIYPALLKAKTCLRPGSPHCTPFTQEKIQVQGSQFSDGDILRRTLCISRSRSDDDLEQFFKALPGFCASKIVDSPRRSLDVLGLPRLAEALIEFWNRTLSSDRDSESVKVRRLVVCVRVIEAADLSIAVPHILHLFSGDLGEVSRSVETGHSLRPLRNGNAASLARGIIACIISNAERDDRWSMLAMDELGISGNVLRDYLAHGDSVLLANLIHITRHFFHGLLQPHPDLTREALSILPSVSKFDILNTLPELQRDFCDLWNEVVQQARNSPSEADDNLFVDILVEIRHLHIDLHGATTDHDDIFHQPLCMTPDHHPKSTTHTQEAKGNTTGGASQTITIASPIPSPGDVLDVSHDTATGMGITQGIRVTESCMPSMAERVTQSPSSTSSDRPPDREITKQEFPSSTPRPNALLPSNPQVPTVSAPDITSGTGISSTTTRRANDNGQDLDPINLIELTDPPNQSLPSVVDANNLQP